MASYNGKRQIAARESTNLRTDDIVGAKPKRKGFDRNPSALEDMIMMKEGRIPAIPTYLIFEQERERI